MSLLSWAMSERFRDELHAIQIDVLYFYVNSTGENPPETTQKWAQIGVFKPAGLTVPGPLVLHIYHITEDR